MLTLTRPLTFFDLETTGVDPYNDRIVQIGAIQLMPDGTKKEKEWLVNPGMPIPKSASDIHGITNDMVQDAPRLGDIIAELQEWFIGVDLGGYNVKNFDIPLLIQEFQRIGLMFDIENISIVDAMKIFQIKEPRTLAAAYQKFCGKELVDAHNAMVDITASLEVLYGQMNTYDDLPATPKALHEFCFPEDPNAYDAEGKLLFVDGVLTINFGKNKGKTLQELALNDPGYLEWINKGSFSDPVKQAVRKVLGYK
ncbi:3'-5' exonuclease [Patescibacteria group bacterium]|nr:3'-5' exonuclease [Patescibacteria group bacterium]MBU1722058.1 3'-5' exonuclease [Patescibacteria group bacterium]MBU1901529.1 3'-5' exonuclease [Patescibacteria group bacterium]